MQALLPPRTLVIRSSTPSRLPRLLGLAGVCLTGIHLAGCSAAGRAAPPTQAVKGARLVDAAPVKAPVPWTDTLRRSLGRLAARAPARRAAIYLQEIPTGLTLGINPNRPFVAASLIKLPVMAASYAFWERHPRLKTEKALGWNEAMITVSDNPCTNRLIDMLGGEGPVIRFCEDRGWPNFRLRHALRWHRARGPNTCTAREVVEFLVRLDQRRLVSPEADEEMWQVLSRSRRRARLPAGLPDLPGLEVGNKTGTLSYVLHDAALVRTPRTRYALCILLSGYRSEGEGNRFCRRVSRLVFDALHGPVGPQPSIARNETRPAE